MHRKRREHDVRQRPSCGPVHRPFARLGPPQQTDTAKNHMAMWSSVISGRTLSRSTSPHLAVASRTAPSRPFPPSAAQHNPHSASPARGSVQSGFNEVRSTASAFRRPSDLTEASRFTRWTLSDSLLLVIFQEVMMTRSLNGDLRGRVIATIEDGSRHVRRHGASGSEFRRPEPGIAAIARPARRRRASRASRRV